MMKISEVVKSIIACVMVLVGWVIFTVIFLIPDPESAKYVVNQDNIFVLLGLMIIVSCFALWISALWMNKWYNRRTRLRTTSQLSYDISRWYLDGRFEEYAEKFGIVMDRYSITIRPGILVHCDLSCLARLLSFLFYRNFDSLSASVADTPDVFFGLADILLEAWPKEKDPRIQAFLDFFDTESIFLGGHLKYALERQRINSEVEKFEARIKDRLAEIEQKYSASDAISQESIGRQLMVCSYLANGGSAIRQHLSGFLRSEPSLSSGLSAETVA